MTEILRKWLCDNVGVQVSSMEEVHIGSSGGRYVLGDVMVDSTQFCAQL